MGRRRGLNTLIYQESQGYNVLYKKALEFSIAQQEANWTAEEINVELDTHSLMLDFTEAETFAITTNLKAFTEYEIIAGVDYWGGRIINTFSRPELQRMASTFSYFELAVHAPFYIKINDALHLNSEEFHKEFLGIDCLRERIKLIGELVNHPNDLVSLGSFAFVEGVILYSSFAFFLHFGQNGKNKIPSFISGIEYSARDENLHAMATCWLFNQVKKEKKEAGQWSKEEEDGLKSTIVEVAEKARKHEYQLIELMLSKGPIQGYDEQEAKTFVDSRINLMMQNLGYEALYTVNENPIKDWFTRKVAGSTKTDFFTAAAVTEYTDFYSEADFIDGWGESKMWGMS